MNPTPDQYAIASTIVVEEMSGNRVPKEGVDALKEQLKRASSSERQGIVDSMRSFFSEAEMLPPDRLRRINSALAEQGLPSLATFVGTYDNELAAILPAVLTRGSILDEKECGAVEEELKDMTSDLTTAQRIQLGKMLNNYYGRANPA